MIAAIFLLGILFGYALRGYLDRRRQTRRQRIEEEISAIHQRMSLAWVDRSKRFGIYSEQDDIYLDGPYAQRSRGAVMAQLGDPCPGREEAQQAWLEQDRRRRW